MWKFAPYNLLWCLKYFKQNFPGHNSQTIYTEVQNTGCTTPEEEKQQQKQKERKMKMKKINTVENLSLMTRLWLSMILREVELILT